MICENQTHPFTVEEERTLGKASPFFQLNILKEKEAVSNPAKLCFYFLSQKFHMLWKHRWFLVTRGKLETIRQHSNSQLNVLFSEILLRSFCVLQFNISFTTERISNASFLLTKLLSSQQTRQKPSLNYHISLLRPRRKCIPPPKNPHSQPQLLPAKKCYAIFKSSISFFNISKYQMTKPKAKTLGATQ